MARNAQQTVKGSVNLFIPHLIMVWEALKTWLRFIWPKMNNVNNCLHPFWITYNLLLHFYKACFSLINGRYHILCILCNCPPPNSLTLESNVFLSFTRDIFILCLILKAKGQISKLLLKICKKNPKIWSWQPLPFISWSKKEGGA